VPVKLSIGEQTYRVRVNTFLGLEQAVRGFTDYDGCTMAYLDGDNELINLSSDREFAEALLVFQEAEGKMSALRGEDCVLGVA